MPLEQPPPRDSDGNVLPHDHPEIVADDQIIRRISEKQLVLDKDGRRRISSKAFQPSSGPNGGMSVDFERLIAEAGLDPRVFVTTPRWTGSVYWSAAALRTLGFKVGSDPLPENPYHGEVWGDFRKKREMQATATWFVEIPGASTS